MKLVLLKTSSESIEAHLIKTKLESEGIPVVLLNEHYTNLLPNHFQLMGSGIQIKVLESDAERAMAALDHYFPSKKEATCPNCGSSKLEMNFGGKKWKKRLLAFIAIIIFIPMNILGGNLICMKCGTEFRN